MLRYFILFDFLLSFFNFVSVGQFLFEILLCFDPLLLICIPKHHDFLCLLGMTHDPLALGLYQLIQIALEGAWLRLHEAKLTRWIFQGIWLVTGAAFSHIWGDLLGLVAGIESYQEHARGLVPVGRSFRGQLLFDGRGGYVDRGLVSLFISKIFSLNLPPLFDDPIDRVNKPPLIMLIS